jgi:hypothetical protein
VVLRALTALFKPSFFLGEYVGAEGDIMSALVNNTAITSAAHMRAFLSLLTDAERMGGVPLLDTIDDLVDGIWTAPFVYSTGAASSIVQANPLRVDVDQRQVIGGTGPRHVQWMALVARQLAWTEMLVLPNVQYALRGPAKLQWEHDFTVLNTWLAVHYQMFSDHVHFVGAQQQLHEKGPWSMRQIITKELGRDALMALRFVYKSIPFGATGVDADQIDQMLFDLLAWADPEDATDAEVFGPLTRLVAQLLIETLVREMPAGMLTPANLVLVMSHEDRSFASPHAVLALLTAALLEARGMVLTDEDQAAILVAMTE